MMLEDKTTTLWFENTKDFFFIKWVDDQQDTMVMSSWHPKAELIHGGSN